MMAEPSENEHTATATTEMVDIDDENDDFDDTTPNSLNGEDDSDSDTIRLHDEDPVAEGEEPPPPKPEPSQVKASSIKFYTICQAVEKVWEAGIKNKKWSDDQKLCTILPPAFLKGLDTPSKDGDRPESIFPIFRLLMPDKDGSRQFQMAEKILAAIYAGALELSQTSLKYKKLLFYTDRDVVRTKSEGQGDFSVVVQHVVGTTKVKDKRSGFLCSGFTVDQINQALNELASLPGRARSIASNHDWKQTSEGGSGKKTKKAPTLKELRIQWLKRLNADTPRCPGLFPLEHKWLVRVLLRKLQFNVVRSQSSPVLFMYDRWCDASSLTHTGLSFRCSSFRVGKKLVRCD